MLGTLAEDQVTQYAQDGYLFPIDVFSKTQAADYRAQLESVEADNKDNVEAIDCIRSNPNFVLPFIDDITRHPSIADAVASILGPDLIVYSSSFFTKQPNSPHYVSWHQDLHYWGLEEDDQVTAWLALSPATRQSGCMRFVPGSHTSVVEHRDTYHQENLLTRGQELAVDVDEADAVDAELAPGQMSLHHGRLFHASHANSTDDRRIGLAIRYIKTSMRQGIGARQSATLARGKDDFNHFDLIGRPRGIMDPRDVERLRQNNAIKNAVLYRETETAT